MLSLYVIVPCLVSLRLHRRSSLSGSKKLLGQCLYVFATKRTRSTQQRFFSGPQCSVRAPHPISRTRWYIDVIVMFDCSDKGMMLEERVRKSDWKFWRHCVHRPHRTGICGVRRGRTLDTLHCRWHHITPSSCTELCINVHFGHYPIFRATVY